MNHDEKQVNDITKIKYTKEKKDSTKQQMTTKQIPLVDINNE